MGAILKAAKELTCLITFEDSTCLFVFNSFNIVMAFISIIRCLYKLTVTWE